MFMLKKQQIYTEINKSVYHKIYQNNLNSVKTSSNNIKTVFFQPIIQEFINETNFYYQSS